MNTRRFSTLVTIEQNANSANSDIGAEDIEDWTEVRKEWADIRPLRGQEYLIGQQMVGKTTHKMWTHHGTHSAEWRVVDGSTTYHVESVVEMGGWEFYLEWRLIKAA